MIHFRKNDKVVIIGLLILFVILSTIAFFMGQIGGLDLFITGSSGVAMITGIYRSGRNSDEH